MNGFAVQKLNLRPSNRMLEVGFEGGISLPELLAGTGYVAGVDRSADVVTLADRAEFRAGSAELLPYDAGCFTKIRTVNTVSLLSPLDKAVPEIFRVLAPKGRVAIGFLPKRWMDPVGRPAGVFTSRTSEGVARALLEVGFRGVHIALPQHPAAWNVIVAKR